MSEIKDFIKADGQPYIDEPIMGYLEPTGVSRSVSMALGARPAPRIRIVTGYDRVKLRWLKPDGKGGLVPR
jgi:hypothetical protein